jgi:hypothetical protein
MSPSFAQPVLLISGIVTALAGLPVALAPKPALRALFGVREPDAATRFFARHWAVLITLMGLLLAGSAYVESARTMILAAGATEKFIIAAMIFFGPLQRTRAALTDTAFALFYVTYIAGW